jgi:hypothetical protein
MRCYSGDYDQYSLLGYGAVYFAEITTYRMLVLVSWLIPRP